MLEVAFLMTVIEEVAENKMPLRCPLVQSLEAGRGIWFRALSQDTVLCADISSEHACGPVCFFCG